MKFNFGNAIGGAIGNLKKLGSIVTPANVRSAAVTATILAGVGVTDALARDRNETNVANLTTATENMGSLSIQPDRRAKGAVLGEGWILANGQRIKHYGATCNTQYALYAIAQNTPDGAKIVVSSREVTNFDSPNILPRDRYEGEANVADFGSAHEYTSPKIRNNVFKSGWNRIVQALTQGGRVPAYEIDVAINANEAKNCHSPGGSSRSTVTVVEEEPDNGGDDDEVIVEKPEEENPGGGDDQNPVDPVIPVKPEDPKPPVKDSDSGCIDGCKDLENPGVDKPPVDGIGEHTGPGRQPPGGGAGGALDQIGMNGNMVLGDVGLLDERVNEILEAGAAFEIAQAQREAAEALVAANEAEIAQMNGDLVQQVADLRDAVVPAQNHAANLPVEDIHIQVADALPTTMQTIFTNQADQGQNGHLIAMRKEENNENIKINDVAISTKSQLAPDATILAAALKVAADGPKPVAPPVRHETAMNLPRYLIG